MKLNRLVEILKDEFSTHSVMNYVSRISQYHRIQGSTGYLDIARYIKSSLEENNIPADLIEEIKNGGK